ncbi:uncharacterized protein LOC123295904 [Chrysoperla carnea]|uniref:uncharacterized protein LOC123295904 n=1 Tax=Chrysoperla carnea TaxID=189513 RepID=UPI001D097413|nr:uncharacterized protein LOC123295904 [Chrysoperla carnea]
MIIHESKQSSNLSVNLHDIRLQKEDIQVTNKSNDSSITGNEVKLVKEILKNVLNGNTELGGYTSFGDVSIESSSQVHVGNITYINGPVNINYNVNKVEYSTDIKQEIHVSMPLETPPTIPMIYRDMWLAEPPYEELFRTNPAANLVIICHTATSSSTTQSGNISAVRLIQTFHIESNGWSDIGYNFLIGCDGQVYEGRGWRKVGAHSKGFNQNSLGITFIGTFNTTLPSQKALDVCHRLIAFGVQQGMIDTDYQLIGHCQCRPFLSPGNALYETIKTWPHWKADFTDNQLIENPDNFLSNFETHFVDLRKMMEEFIKTSETKPVGIRNDENNNRDDSVLTQLEQFSKESDEHINNEKQERLGNAVLSKMLINQANEMTIHETKQASQISVNLNDILLQKKDIQITNKSNDSSINGNEVELVKEIFKNVLNENTELCGYTSFGDVSIESSSQVHVGNITYINGPVNINYNVNKVEYSTDIKQEIHISTPLETPHTIPMVYRDMWLAKSPYEEPLRTDKAAKLIIICHTQTSPCTNRAGNESCVRLIQSYHMESNGWNDIGYNFLIGCDGRVYEGCGWRRVGRHSKGFNENSLGIAFIGTFNDTLPSQKAIDVCHGLIAYGVEKGMIDTNYELIGHCQCRSFSSPGKTLFKAIQTWPHWAPNFTENMHIMNISDQYNENSVSDDR